MTTQVAVERDGMFRRRRTVPSGNINQTLSELGIEPGVDTDVAVQIAAADFDLGQPEPTRDERAELTARRLKAMNDGKIAARRKREEEALSQPEASDDDDEMPQETSSPIPQGKRRSGRPLGSKNKPKLTLAAPPEEVAEQPEAEPGMFSVPMSAPPSTLKGRVQKPSPALGKLGTTIAAMMPGAERVRVEKRLPAGNLGFVADYTKQDLASHPDLQSFLSRYVKPSFGPGEYKVTGLDSMGRMYEAGSVHLLDPPTGTDGTGAMGLVQGMLQQQQKNHEEQIKELKETMQAQPNPVTMLREVTSLQKELAPPPPAAPPSSDGTLAAVITSSANTTSQMMQMMMQQQQAAQAAQQQQTMLMIQQMQAANQQQMTMFMEMFKAKESSSASPGSSPMPPPPPPESPLSGVKEIISMLGDMGVFGGNSAPPPDDTFKQIVLANQLGVKDVLALVKEMSPAAREGGGNGIKEAFDNMAVVMNMANQLKQNTEGSPQATIWDAVAALVSNRDFAGSIASAIRVNTEQVQRQTQSSQQTQLLAQQRALQLAAQQRQQLAMQQRQAQIDEREIVATPPAPRRAPVVESAPDERDVTNVVPIRKPSAVEKSQEAAERLKSQQVQAPPSLPPGFEAKVSDIVEAVSTKDDAQIVEKTVNMVMFFYGFDQWKPVATGLLASAQAGDKEKTLEMLGGFMGAFIEMGMIKKMVGNEVLRCIDTHFETIHQQLSGKPASILPPGIEEVFVVPDPEEIDETGNPIEENDDEDGEGEEGDGEGDGEEVGADEEDEDED